jgi:YfiH family protein
MLPCFKSKLLDQIPHVTHGFFTRNGGVSCGQYATLNTLERKTDNPQHVIEKRRRITENLGGGILQFNNQIHSTIVHHVVNREVKDGDAMITQTPRLLIGVQTADCMPILMAHKTQKIVAAVHAGWKGALTGVIQATLDQLKQMCALDELVCVIGPCIATENFEVGEDVYKLAGFPGVTGSSASRVETVSTGTQKTELDPGSQETLGQQRCQVFHNVRETNSPSQESKWNLDLRALATQVFQDYGIVHIDHIKEDTYSQPDLFFSYRRATHKQDKIFGGQASVIGIL